MQVSYSQLSEMTGKAYRTIKKRINAAGLQPVGGKSGANLWESQTALEAIYAPMAICDGLDPQQEKAKLDEARRIAQEMKNAELEGRLIDAEEVAKIAFDVARQSRDALMGIGNRIKATIITFDDANEAGRLIDSEIRQALESLSRSLKA